MWETIQGTDLETDYERSDLPGSTVPERERKKKLRISGTTIDVLNAIIEPCLSRFTPTPTRARMGANRI